jgi:hypothetical protein
MNQNPSSPVVTVVETSGFIADRNLVLFFFWNS